MVAARGFYLMLSLPSQAAPTPEIAKVFWFFSSEKNCFLLSFHILSLRPARMFSTFRYPRGAYIMGLMLRRMALAAGCAIFAGGSLAAPVLRPDTPTKFTPRTASFDYERRDEMIPMRDG